MTFQSAPDYAPVDQYQHRQWFFEVKKALDVVSANNVLYAERFRRPGLTDTEALQAAVTASYGKLLLITGSWSVATTGNTDASSGAVGHAITITDEITIGMVGEVAGTNNCNIFNVAAGSTDVVCFCDWGGQIRGFGTWVAGHETYNFNGANIRIETGILQSNVRLVDPVQYAVYATANSNGDLRGTVIEGGSPTYLGDNNYGVCFGGSCDDWNLDGLKIIAGSAGGKVSQGVASNDGGDYPSGTADRLKVRDVDLTCHEKGFYLYGDDAHITGSVYDCENGEGVRVVGKRAHIDVKVRSCVSGGVTLYDAEGSYCKAEVSDCGSAGVQISYRDAVAGKSLDDIVVDLVHKGRTTGSNIGAVDIRGHASSASTIKGIKIRVKTESANRDVADTRAAVDVSVSSSSTTFEDLVIEADIKACGGHGVRLGAATYKRPKIKARVIDPGMDSATVGDKAALKIDASVTLTYGDIEIYALEDAAGSGMNYGIDNSATNNVQKTKLHDSWVKGHATSAYLNMQHASNTRLNNRIGDDPPYGTFTMDADASITLSNTNSISGMWVNFIPTNNTAYTLQAGTKGLIVGTITADTSFNADTADATAAAGTETFRYVINGVG